MKYIVIFALVLTVFFVSCGDDDVVGGKSSAVASGGVITVEDFVSRLIECDDAPFKSKTALFSQPMKKAIEKYGDSYEISWEGVYARLHFTDEKCAFEAYVGAEFEHYDWYNNYTDFKDCDVMEYLRYTVIDRVIFDGDGITLVDGISIGQSAGEIAEELGVDGVDYSGSCSMKHSDYNDSGKYVKVYTTFCTIDGADYVAIFEDDILASIEMVNSTEYLSGEKTEPEDAKKILNKALSFVIENDLASFNKDSLSYKGKRYSRYYDTYICCWQFSGGDYDGYEVNVEQNKPNRVFLTAPLSEMPILFWCDGKYIDPMLSFLGKWRDYDQKEYINIKSISKEGVVVFDMYTDVTEGGEMMLFENLNAVINEIPKNLDEYVFNQMIYESLDGDAQFFNDQAQSGCYGYAGDKYYLMDSIIMDLAGSVKYLTRSHVTRVGSATLAIHIPEKSYNYTQAETWGYMENFGRDDTNKDNVVSKKSSGGGVVINSYLNDLYKTTDLNYADIEYTYLYDYVFPVNDTTYNVWRSKNANDPHYLYIDNKSGMIIKESAFNSISKHSKELIWKTNTRVDKRSYAYQSYATLDGKIVIDFENRKITNTDAFAQEIEIEDIGIDCVRGNERYMFFSQIGERFALNGYVVFDHTTWGASLHITDSNIPNFDIGVYYLDCQTFFLDPSVGVIGVPEESENKDYVEDKVEEVEKETKLVIREFSGKIIGYIHIAENGDKTVKAFSGKILGYYDASRDVTTNFAGKILYQGDASSALLFDNQG